MIPSHGNETYKKESQTNITVIPVRISPDRGIPQLHLLDMKTSQI